MKKSASLGKKVLMVILVILSSMLIAGCFNENANEVNKTKNFGSVLTTEKNGNLLLTSVQDIVGVEITLKGQISENVIESGKNYISTIKSNSNETKIALAKISETSNEIIAAFKGIKAENVLSVKVISKEQMLKEQLLKKAVTTEENVLLGDFDNDGSVNLIDIAAFKTAYATKSGSSDYSVKCDIYPSKKGTQAGWENIYSVATPDNEIGILDFVIFASNFGKKIPVNNDGKDVADTKISLQSWAVTAGLDKVAADLALPTTGINGAVIKWSSSNTDVVSDSGKVTRAAIDTKLILTANISKNATSSAVAFDITVLKDGRTYNVLLKSLNCSEVTLTPVFAADITTYSALVSNSVTKATIGFAINDSTNKVTFGTDTSETGKTDYTKLVALNVGVNLVTIKIESDDASVQKTYIINITRDIPTEGLATPTGFKATATSTNSITLGWDVVTGATGYRLSKSEVENGSFTEIGGATITINYKSPWSKAFAHYKDDTGKWTTAPGTEMKMGTDGIATITLNTKTLEICFNDGNSVVASRLWDSNASANYKIGEAGIYSIVTNTAPVKTGSVESIITGNSYKDVSLLPGKTYFYKIQAINNTEQSTTSSALSVSTETPPMEINILPYLTWNKADQATNGIVVNYGTNGACPAKVEYGTTEALGSIATGEDVTVNTSLYLHHVVIEGLAPGTKYFYRVTGGSNKSAIYNFKTSELNDKNFRFFMVGDMQDPGGNVQRWNANAHEMKLLMDTTPVDFFICIGDMPQDDIIENWVSFFRLGKELFPYIVFMPTLGNHDTDGTTIGKPIWDSNPTPAGVANFKKFFKHVPVETRNNITSDGTYYSFNYGSAQFSALNTEVTYMGSVDLIKDAQYTWVSDKITTESKNFAWNFAYWHIPAYNAASDHHDEIYKIKPITQVLDGKIDWVINGHIHSYQRFKPMSYDSLIKSNYGIGDDKGIGYMILPSAGNVPRAYSWKSEAEKATLNFPVNGDASTMAEVGFGLVDIADKVIDIKVYGIGNTTTFKPLHVIDSVSYTK